jgi:hypothetical protein
MARRDSAGSAGERAAVSVADALRLTSVVALDVPLRLRVRWAVEHRIDAVGIWLVEHRCWRVAVAVWWVCRLW